MRQQRICATISRNKTTAAPFGQSQICRITRPPPDKCQRPVSLNQMCKFVQIMFPAQNRHNIATNS
jgi:hypothetical protein